MDNIIDSGDFEQVTFARKLLYHGTTPLRNYLVPASALKKLLSRSKSPLIQEFFANPGGWRAMEVIYDNQPPLDFFDRMALIQPVAVDARNRRRFVIQQLLSWFEEAKQDSSICLLGIGTGPALELLEAASQRPRQHIEIYAVDLDDSAFDYGLERARAQGLEDSICYIKGDARQLNLHLQQKQPQIVTLIGLIEYLSDSEVIDLLQAVAAVTEPGSHLLTHGFQDPYRTQPFFQRVFGMQIIQRTGQEVVDLLERAGFQNATIEMTPLEIYPMVSATRGTSKFSPPSENQHDLGGLESSHHVKM